MEHYSDRTFPLSVSTNVYRYQKGNAIIKLLNEMLVTFNCTFENCKLSIAIYFQYIYIYIYIYSRPQNQLLL